MTPKLKKIIITVLVLGIAFFAYTAFRSPSEPEPLVSGTSNVLNTRNLAETQRLGQQITQALNQIENIVLERGVFENPIFNRLEDRSQRINPEAVGRRNPFAPLSDTSVNYTVGIQPDSDDPDRPDSVDSSDDAADVQDPGSASNSSSTSTATTTNSTVQ